MLEMIDDDINFEQYLPISFKTILTYLTNTY